MKIIINKSNHLLTTDNKPTITIQDKLSSSRHLFFGHPMLYDSKPFSENLYCLIEDRNPEDFIPRLSGDYLYIKIENDKIDCFNVDFFGQTRFYYLELEEKLIISDSIFELSKYHTNVSFDINQIIHFLSKGYTWNGGTFFKNLRIITPSAKYSLVEGKINSTFYELHNYNFNKRSLDSITGDVLEGLSLSNYSKRIAIMFSGGLDSTYLSFIASKRKIEFDSSFTNIANPIILPNLDDVVLCSELDNRLNLKVKMKKIDAYDVLKRSLNRTFELLPFEFHVSIFQKDLIELSKSNGTNLVITGQNADSLYNYGKTTYIKPTLTISKLMTGRLKGSGITVLLDRYFQTYRFQRRTRNDKNSLIDKIAWKKINPNKKLNVSNLLAGFILSDKVLPILDNDFVSEIVFKNEKDTYYEWVFNETNTLAKRLKTNPSENVRDLLLRTKLLGHCQGRDVRCITEWSREIGVRNCQIYATAPIFTKLSRINLNFRDIIRPKRQIYKYLKHSSQYFEIKKDMKKNNSNKSVENKYEFETEVEYLSSLYSSIEDEFNMNESINYALDILEKSGRVDINILKNKIDEDLSVKFKLGWAGKTLQNYMDKCNSHKEEIK